MPWLTNIRPLEASFVCSGGGVLGPLSSMDIDVGTGHRWIRQYWRLPPTVQACQVGIWRLSSSLKMYCGGGRWAKASDRNQRVPIRKRLFGRAGSTLLSDISTTGIVRSLR